MTSRYGSWTTRDGLPAFAYEADQEAIPEAEWDPIVAPRTRRHWVMLGNRSIQVQAANDGTAAVWDERFGQRWLTAPDPEGTGVSIVEEEDRSRWGSAWADRPPGTLPLRTFAPTWYEVCCRRGELSLERLILCPEGELPWLLVRVRLRNHRDSAVRLNHVERRELRPRFVTMGEPPGTRRGHAEQALRYRATRYARLREVASWPARLPGGQLSRLEEEAPDERGEDELRPGTPCRGRLALSHAEPSGPVCSGQWACCCGAA